ncbi:hypothetical protein N7467_006827 [Penicillium canescens]|nr:hypothetical protein N7467_006827 [Penicillium canescens]
MWWKLLGLFAIGSIALSEKDQLPFESANFDVSAALNDLGVGLSEISALSMKESSTKERCSIACGSLIHVLGLGKVSSQDTLPYKNFTDSFWSTQQGTVAPRCVIQPSSSKDVSIIVLLARLTDCQFAARSGGHAAFEGASNIPGGISIWFKDMNEITLNEDKSVVSIGPGNLWGQVYETLEPHGLAAVGGRASSIGVGGFILGGGISFHSNLYGWALDNVQSFEVVTASGAIVTASETEHSDLYWALRGGGNNFGLVTKFNLYTIPYTMMRGGARSFVQDQFPEVINAFVNAVNDAPKDGNAQQWLAFLDYQGTKIASAELTYAKDVADPDIFKQYRDIPAVSDTTTSKSLVQYCKDIEASNQIGHREVYWPIATQLNEEFALWTVEEFFTALPQVANVTGILPVLIYHALTEPILEKMSKFGGNALGLDSSTGPVHLLQIACWWDDEADDDTVYRFINSYWETVLEKAQTMGISNGFIYMNYGSKFQDVIAGYGDANAARLRHIASKYDPKEIYQGLQPGYFKLGHAPKSFVPRSSGDTE